MKKTRIVRLPEEHIKMINCVRVNFNQKTFVGAARKASKILEISLFKKKK